MNGIDVSYHQGVIDWKKVKNAGIKFAIIRAGYGKSTMDKKFVENICGADTAGLGIGIYWFIYAANVLDAVANADKCAEVLDKYKSIIKHKVWADWEYDSDKWNPQTKDGRTAIVKAFCERLSAKDYDVGVYANPDYINSKFDMKQLSQYPLWLARYSAEKGNYNPYMWQHSSTGKVAGITGNVDLNIMYGAPAPEYYPAYTETLNGALNQLGITSTYEFRKKIAAANKISNYTGTAEQNIKMLSLLKEGKLIKP